MLKEFSVLMVDDDPGDAGLVKAAISSGRFCCNLRHVPDGIEAIKLLRGEILSEQSPPRPDLILLDINMPRKSGHDVLNELKADSGLCDIPVVMLTTSDAERDITSAYRAGAAGYVTKPVDIEDLFVAIQGLQDYWFGLMQLPHRPR